MPAYLHGLLVACDQLLNALLGGWPDETLSSRCWRWQSERTGRQMPPELR